MQYESTAHLVCMLCFAPSNRLLSRGRIYMLMQANLNILLRWTVHH